MSSPFRLVSPYRPQGDQPRAIEKLVEDLESGKRWQTLLGVTGSGKTFTMANVIAQCGKPALVICHNKTLAAQLYAEFRQYFPRNAVHYFVSYYDYYQPEAYLPQKDIYIEKDAMINEDIDRLRLAATSALMSRRDVVIVASVSCIYGLGSPEDYLGMVLRLRRGEQVPRQSILERLVEIQYERNDAEFRRGRFRIRGDSIEVFPAYEEHAVRIELRDHEVESLSVIAPLTGRVQTECDELTVFPAKHYVLPEDKITAALPAIEKELRERLEFFRSRGKPVESQRLEARTLYDLEMLREVGYCKGIENYSRHLSGRMPGQRPYTLIDFFPKDYLVFVDESHVTVPQLGGMYHGDTSRKLTLVEYGFRLPSALDNRPMTFEEWEATVSQGIFVSATPARLELERSAGEAVEQIIRPTGLVDPEIEVRPAEGQVEDLLREIRQRARRKQRVLVTTLTKRLAEDLSRYLEEADIRSCYLHSEIETFNRVEILRNLREGTYDVLVGVNLLREGLDLPEVTLVAILDADKEGFLRSETSLVQTAGRTARNVDGKVILYAERMTDSMQRAIRETSRRRTLQLEFNQRHGITPKTIKKEILRGIELLREAKSIEKKSVNFRATDFERVELVRELEQEMNAAAEKLDFERAAGLRDRILEIQGKPPARPPQQVRPRGMRSRGYQ